jgi:hypothetical protein
MGPLLLLNLVVAAATNAYERVRENVGTAFRSEHARAVARRIRVACPAEPKVAQRRQRRAGFRIACVACHVRLPLLVFFFFCACFYFIFLFAFFFFFDFCLHLSPAQHT